MRRILAPILAASMLAAPASAAEPAPAPGWVVDYGELRCSLIRQSGATTLALQTLPGTGTWQLRLVSRRWPRAALRNADQLAISLQPAGASIPAERFVSETRAGEALVFHRLPSAFLGQFAAAEGIRVSRNGETVVDIPFTGAGPAVAAVGRCEEQIMREWGIDPVSFAALRSPPRGNVAEVVTDRDYPSAAVNANQSGTTVVRLTVETNGRVSDCATVVSSGHAVLDSRTCEIYRERLRLAPAIGADGAPTAAPMVAMLRWVLPD